MSYNGSVSNLYSRSMDAADQYTDEQLEAMAANGMRRYTWLISDVGGVRIELKGWHRDHVEAFQSMMSFHRGTPERRVYHKIGTPEPELVELLDPRRALRDPMRGLGRNVLEW